MGKRKTLRKQNEMPGNEWKPRLIYSTDATIEGRAEEIFSNKPFKKLDAKKFKSKKRCLEKNYSGNIENDPDREMFIKAILQPGIEIKNALPSGFRLGEYCTLPSLSPKKQKKKDPPPSIKPPVQTIPTPEEDENTAFLLAMRKTKPLSGKGREISKRPVLKENAVHEQGFEELLGKQLEFTLLFSDEYLEGKVAGLDEMIMNRLREGQMSPEAHLDLHGLNVEQAFEALRVFIRDAWFKSLRVVLLVPGRGKNSPAGYAILRRKVQEWLTHDPFKRVVLAFCTARPHDGGPGSIYVLLRKFRKKGHISWDKLAADADLFNF